MEKLRFRTPTLPEPGQRFTTTRRGLKWSKQVDAGNEVELATEDGTVVAFGKVAAVDFGTLTDLSEKLVKLDQFPHSRTKDGLLHRLREVYGKFGTSTDCTTLTIEVTGTVEDVPEPEPEKQPEPEPSEPSIGEPGKVPTATEAATTTEPAPKSPQEAINAAARIAARTLDAYFGKAASKKARARAYLKAAQRLKNAGLSIK